MSVDWEALKALRALYIADPGVQQSRLKHDYWQDAKLLAAYDLTFAARIGWKWDAVLSELAQEARFPTSARFALYDWGTGTGVAARAALAAGLAVSRVRLWDRSAQALAFAASKVRACAPTVDVATFEPGSGFALRPALLTVSHVLTELDPTARDTLVALAATADAVIWIEPGTPLVARQLAEIRETLRDTLTPLAPCTHRARCGMLDPVNERHWCHHFAKPPSSASRDPFWSEFQKRLGIDLRSLPVSYLVMARENFLADEARDTGGERVIGRPRPYKGHTKYLGCAASGVAERDYAHRAGKATARALAEAPFRLVLHGDHGGPSGPDE